MALIDQFERMGRDGAEYRGVPFWSWNDELDPQELSRQVKEMKKAGLGGHFMHARKGLVTEYMGPSWLECIKSTVKASKEAGLKAWLYDENCWPSGTGGGAIPALNAAYVACRLCWELVSPAGFKPRERAVATFLVKPADGRLADVRPQDPKTAVRRAKPDDQILHFYAEPVRHGNPWDYTDLLNPKAVKEFIHHTYQGYSTLVRREFGKTVPGIFTDEPQWSRPIPWSTCLPNAFKKLNGYDLLDSLPMLAFETGDYQAFRYDFWYAATQLFVESFTRQIGEWCGKRKIALTGHLNAEDSLASQMSCVGAAMPHYQHMQTPGIDHLCRRITDPLLCKQVSSVAHQFGGRRVLSEMFGCAGWNISFEELKWIAEWQLVQGVDLICQHLSLYSLRGCRKRDYPPSLHYQQPWWDDYKLLNDYFARLTLMLTRGKHVADILLLHTIESAWTSYRPDDSSEVDALNADLVALSSALLGMHCDFDFGDESILAEHGRTQSDGTLRIKSCTYSVVIVPRCVTLRSTTLALLQRFMERGGAVVLTGPPPGRVDGRPSDDAAAALADADQIQPRAAALRSLIRKLLPPRIEVLSGANRNATSIYVQQRSLASDQIFFLANINSQKAVTTRVRLPGGGRVERWDCETGEPEVLKTRKRGNMTELELTFPPAGSHLLVQQKRRRPVAVRTRRPRPAGKVDVHDAWLVERKDPNALTIDRCSYRIADGDWSEPTPVLRVQDDLRHINDSEVCEFKYAFQADFAEKLPQFVHLAVETPDAYEISMNGLSVGTTELNGSADLGWWRDVSFRRLDVSRLLKPQDTNEIVLRRLITGEAERRRLMEQLEARPERVNRLRYGPEIESLYVIGDFMVRSATRFRQMKRRALATEGPFVLCDNWRQATPGDLVQQGLPFYAGTVRLCQTVMIPERRLKPIKGATLAFDPPDAIVTKVYVNEHLAGRRGWQPYQFEVGEWLKPGRNDLVIELTGSCRNLLGPHHHVTGELFSVGPQSFRATRGWTDESGTPENIWTNRYSFVRFGLVGPVTLTLWK